MKRVYIKPTTRVRSASLNTALLGHSYDYADSKQRGFYDEEEEATSNDHSDWSTDYWK